MITIAVAGAKRGVGVTHTAISIATALKKKLKTAVLQKYNDSSFLSLGQELGEIEDGAEGDYFRYSGVDYFLKDKGFALFGKEYECLICDYADHIGEELLHADYVFFVMPTRAWQRNEPDVIDACERLDGIVGLENVYVVAPFANKSAQKCLKEFFGKGTVMFTDYEEDPFSESGMCLDGIIVSSKGDKKKFKLLESKITELEKKTAESEQEKEKIQSRLKEKEAKLREHIETLSKTEEELLSVKEKAEQTEVLLKESEEAVREKEKLVQAKEADIREKEESLKEKEEEVKEKEASITSYTLKLREQEEALRQEKTKKEELEHSYKQKLTEKEAEAKKLEERLYASTHDELTGLQNRRSFNEALKGMSEYILIFFDVNELKETNDTYGHSAGDKLLKTVSEVIHEVFPRTYRVGGDEFNVITDKSEFNEDKLREIDNKLRDITENRQEKFTYSVAYGYADSSEGTPEEVRNLADMRMYEDKKLKKGVPAEEVKEVEENQNISGYTSSTSSPEVPEPPMPAKPVKRREEPVFSPDTVIPNTLPFGEDDPFKKALDTMFFTKINVAYETTQYRELTLWVFATEYVKPPVTVKTIVVYEDNGYKCLYGTNNELTVNGVTFVVNGRFSDNGEFKTAVIPLTEACKVLDRQEVVNQGDYTPKHFGLCLNGAEVYPIRQNIDGMCDSVILKDGELTLSKGYEQIDGKTYELVLSFETFEAVEA